MTGKRIATVLPIDKPRWAETQMSRAEEDAEDISRELMHIKRREDAARRAREGVGSSGSAGQCGGGVVVGEQWAGVGGIGTNTIWDELITTREKSDANRMWLVERLDDLGVKDDVRLMDKRVNLTAEQFGGF